MSSFRHTIIFWMEWSWYCEYTVALTLDYQMLVSMVVEALEGRGPRELCRPGRYVPPSPDITDHRFAGLRDLLLSGFLSADYAQLVHRDPRDCGPSVVMRFTDGAPDALNAYHLVQPTLDCEDKQGLLCHQSMGSLTIFMANEVCHTSTLNEQGPSPAHPSLGMVFVQQKKNLTVSKARRHILEDVVCFEILETYHRGSQLAACGGKSTGATVISNERDQPYNDVPPTSLLPAKPHPVTNAPSRHSPRRRRAT
jgi:hypothetical protein